MIMSRYDAIGRLRPLMILEAAAEGDGDDDARGA
jgi:hypothetical protein